MKYDWNLPLNDGQKKEVQCAMRDIGQADNRCIITNELGAINFCHLAALSTSHAQVEFLRERWGWEDFHVNVPENIVIEEATGHYMLDHSLLVPLPEGALVTKIFEVYSNLYDEQTSDYQKPEPFNELFADFLPPNGHGWTYEVLPLEIDCHRRIFRHQIEWGTKENTNVETWNSTGRYQEFAYPYSDLRFRSHAHPLCVIWHAGIELNKLSIDQRTTITKRLKAQGASQLADSIATILALYALWTVPSKQLAAEALPVRAPYKNTSSALEPLTTPSREKDVFDGANDSNSNGASSDSISPFDVSPMLRAASPAPAGHPTQNRSTKQKEISPLDINVPPVTGGSPTQHVERKRRVGDGASQPTASTRSISSSLGLGSQSGRRAESSKQTVPGLAGSETTSCHSKSQVKYDKCGYPTLRSELGQCTGKGKEVAFRPKVKLRAPPLGTEPLEPNRGDFLGLSGHTSIPGNEVPQSMSSGARHDYSEIQSSAARGSGSNQTRDSSTFAASESTTSRDQGVERGSTSASGNAGNTHIPHSRFSAAGPSRSETHSSTSQAGGSSYGNHAGNRDRDAERMGYIQRDPRLNEAGNVSGVRANLSVSGSASASTSRIPRLTANYPQPTVSTSHFFSGSSTGKRSEKSSKGGIPVTVKEPVGTSRIEDGRNTEWTSL
ncbi:hypothetical protein C8R45DRAFT_1098470 [Mycena sanguinolenta]|nr:hypothetical protein C8R45DRAFT_1098470 [Mycena sanguinolenta]